MSAEEVELREEMPILARHEGEWTGEYVEVDPDAEVIDRFDAHLSCRFPDEGEYPYYQVNRYEWSDGTERRIEFPGTYDDGRIVFDNERIYGRAWEAEHDDRTVMLTWTRKDMPGSYFYEMIQINGDDDERVRTWHWFEDDELSKRTLIREHRIDD
jgi:hypothetical protein